MPISITRRTALATGLTAAVAATLAACSGSGSSTDSSSSSSNTLTVWCWDPAFNIYAMQEAEKIYQQDHPDFTLNIVETAWDDVQQKLTTLAQSGDTDQLPDIFLMQNNATQKNIANYPDLFSDLEDSGIDFTEFPDSVVNYSVYDGVHYALPFDSGTAFSAYRTDLLETAGLTVDDFTDITWTKFIELATTVKEATGLPMLSSVAGQSDFIMMVIQSGGSSLFTADGEVNIVGNEVLLEAVNLYKQLVDEGLLIEVNSWDEYVATFVNSKVAGVLNGVWISGSIQTATDQSGLWSITNVPALSSSGATNYTANGGSSWVVSSNANYDLATDFLNSTFAGSTELYDTILPSSGAVANWIPAGQSSVYQEPVEFYGSQAVYADVVAFGAEVPSVNTGVYYYEGRDAVSAALTQIINGTDPATALQDAQETVEFAMS